MTLDVALRLRNVLSANGIPVVMTRRAATSLFRWEGEWQSPIPIEMRSSSAFILTPQDEAARAG